MPKKRDTFASPFVPVEEQPYKIPDNWCWVKLSALSSIISKGTTPTGGKDAYIETGIHFVRAENLNDDGTISHENIAHIAESIHTGSLKRSILQENDILISIAGTLGKTGIVRAADLPLNTNQALAFVRIPFQEISKKYIRNVINSTMIQEILLRKTKATSIPNLTLEIISNCPIPLAPVSEQHRIVDRIESLFAKLDEAREKAEAAVDGFELRKSAIVHKAFTGELTQRWRKEHGVGPDNWETKTSEELFDYVTSGSRGWAQYYSENGAVFVRMGNLDHGTIELDLSDVQHVCLPDKAEGQRSRLQKNDILISITADVGMVGFVREISFEAYINQHIALARPNDENDPEFIAWYLVSDVGLRQMQAKQRGATKVGLGLDDIRTLQLLMPQIEEQKEIVAILDKLIDKERQAKEAAETVLSRIDTMKKAILARALRGELGTNDPAEEWAGGILMPA